MEPTSIAPKSRTHYGSWTEHSQWYREIQFSDIRWLVHWLGSWQCASRANCEILRSLSVPPLISERSTIHMDPVSNYLWWNFLVEVWTHDSVLNSWYVSHFECVHSHLILWNICPWRQFSPCESKSKMHITLEWALNQIPNHSQNLPKHGKYLAIDVIETSLLFVRRDMAGESRGIRIEFTHKYLDKFEKAQSYTIFSLLIACRVPAGNFRIYSWYLFDAIISGGAKWRTKLPISSSFNRISGFFRWCMYSSEGMSTTEI